MASSKKKKSSKKPAAKTKSKAAPAKASQKSKKAPAKKPTPKKQASKPAPKPVAKAKAKAKPAAKKVAPAKAAPKAAKKLNTGDAWDNAAMAPKVAANTPVVRMSEPSMSPPHALHDHTGGLVSAVDDEEEVAERIHGGEEAVKDADEDTGSPRLDDREDEDE